MSRTRAILRFFTAACVILLLLAAAYCLVIAFPQPAFAYRTVYQNYHVWSDRPIPPEITNVLDDATRRLRNAPLHDRKTPEEIFFCDSPWRMWVYGMHFSTRFGGAADVWLTRHVVIRSSTIPANRINAPSGGAILDEAHRPLSYFIAHEITHNDVSRKYGRTIMVRYPAWLMEGYPDYVGKAGDFDYARNRALFLAGDKRLDVRTSGLYRGYHLKVAYLLDRKGWTLDQVFANPPAEAQLDAWLREEEAAR